MEKIQVNISTASAKQHAIIIRRGGDDLPSSGRRMLLLHGAGVAGELTWTYLANYLTGWDELLIPDLAGMGRSAFLSDAPASLEDYTKQIEELLLALDWQAFDICGYSFGGMVAHQLLSRFRGIDLCFLLEPAMLFAADQTLILQKANDYMAVANRVLQCPEDAAPYLDFLDSVSPQRVRNAQSDRLALERLQQNSRGFAYALRAVSQALIVRHAEFRQWTASRPGISFAGGLSPESMHRRHRLLAEQSSDWQFIEVPAADHSLVFTKPRLIARAMNDLRCSTLQTSL